jgi:hypothetical protein
MHLVVAATVLALAGCATAAPRGTPVAMDASPPLAMEASSAYVPDGEVFASFGRSAGTTNSYGRYRVVGPATSLAVTSQGRWGGTIGGQPALLEARAGRISGAGVELQVTREGEALLVSGLWRGARIQLSFTKEKIQGTPGGGCSLDLRPGDGTSWRGFLACPTPDVAVIRLDGAAMEVPDVAMPQWLFAFLGTLPEGP